MTKFDNLMHLAMLLLIIIQSSIINNLKGENIMAKVKHIDTDEVHYLKSDGKTTKCGFDTTEKPECWTKVGDNSKITCDKNGCKIN